MAEAEAKSGDEGGWAAKVQGVKAENDGGEHPADRMTAQERYDLVRPIGEECVQEEELHNLLANKKEVVCYDGFEPSGRMHIAQGVQKALNVNRLTQAGCTFKFWVADWFAMMNHKFGGDLAKIQTVGRYFIEIWKGLGMDMDRVQFLSSSEEINKNASEYWPLVLNIACKNNVRRIMRCSQIMGRDEADEMEASQIFYPCMQCADIFFLKADICQLGMDQRKVNMLAREYCDAVKKKNKPIVLSHHMLPGLKEGQDKMSKSDPESAIFMEDQEHEVNTKIKKAFCPPQQVADNPCLEYLKHIVMPYNGKLEVRRKPDHGGDKTYESYDEVASDYEQGLLHPGDLKPALARGINAILEPVRRHFKEDPNAAALLKQVKAMRK